MGGLYALPRTNAGAPTWGSAGLTRGSRANHPVEMSLRRAKGLVKVVEGAVEHGSRAVQKVHLGTAARTFAVLELVPGVAAPAAVVRVVHDGWTSAVYATIRGVTKVASSAIGAAIDLADARRDGAEPRPPG